MLKIPLEFITKERLTLIRDAVRVGFRSSGKGGELIVAVADELLTGQPRDFFPDEALAIRLLMERGLAKQIAPNCFELIPDQLGWPGLEKAPTADRDLPVDVVLPLHLQTPAMLVEIRCALVAGNRVSGNARGLLLDTIDSLSAGRVRQPMKRDFEAAGALIKAGVLQKVGPATFELIPSGLNWPGLVNLETVPA